MGAWTEERAVHIIEQALREGAEILSMHFPSIGERIAGDNRRAPTRKPDDVTLGVGIAEGCIDTPFLRKLPPKDSGRDRFGPKVLTKRGRGGLDNEAALGNPAILIGGLDLETVEHV